MSRKYIWKRGMKTVGCLGPASIEILKNEFYINAYIHTYWVMLYKYNLFINTFCENKCVNR